MRTAVVALVIVAAACGRKSRAPAEAPPADAAPSAGPRTEGPTFRAKVSDCTPDGWCRLGDDVPRDEILAYWPLGGEAFWAVGRAGLVLRWDGTTLDHERIGDRDLLDVWSNGTVTWVVGARGFAARHASGAWHPIATGTERDLSSVWGIGDAVWMVTRDELLLASTTGVTRVPLPTGTSGRSVWASAPDDVWVGGCESLQRWNGAEWRAIERPSQGCTIDLQGSSPTDVWAIDTEPHHWDGSRWIGQSTEAVLAERVWVRGPADVWVSTAKGMSRWDGTHWSDLPGSPRGAPLDGDTYVDGAVDITVRGAKPKTVRLGRAAHAEDLWIGGNTVWIAGRYGDGRPSAVSRWTGRTWLRETIAGDLLAIDGAGARPWAVGATEPFSAKSAAWSRDTNGWHREELPLGHVHGVAVISPDDVWAVSEKAALHRSGGAWTVLAIDDRWIGKQLAIAPDGTVFVATQTGLVRWNGTAFERVADERSPDVLIARSRDRVDLVTDDRVHRWSATEKLPDIALRPGLRTTGAVAFGDALLVLREHEGGTSTVALILADADPATPPAEQVIPTSGLSRAAVAADGTIWLLQRPGGDLWFREQSSRPPESPPPPEVPETTK